MNKNRLDVSDNTSIIAVVMVLAGPAVVCRQ